LQGFLGKEPVRINPRRPIMGHAKNRTAVGPDRRRSHSS
jgi:hypothetical protein